MSTDEDDEEPSRETIHKLCAVPCCNSNTKDCPKKWFYQVPAKPVVRNQWLQLAKIDFYVSSNPAIYFCEDHFMVRGGNAWNIYENHIYPTKFECQYFRDPAPRYCLPLRNHDSGKIYQSKTLNIISFKPTKQTKSKECQKMSTITKSNFEKNKTNFYSKLDKHFWDHIHNALIDHNYAKDPHMKKKVYICFPENHHSDQNEEVIEDGFANIPFDEDTLSATSNHEDTHDNIECNEDTESTESIPVFKCDYCEIEYIYKNDLLIHIQKQHLDIEEETLDIKPEIFQCSKCPSSFLNEEDMSKHLQIMHGDLIDLVKHIQKLKSNKNDLPKDTNSNNTSINNENDCELKKSNLERFKDFNFGDLITNIDIKKEFCNPLEDVDLSFENQNFDEEDFALNGMYQLEPILGDNHYHLNDNDMYPNFQAMEYKQTNGKESIAKEMLSIKQEYQENAGNIDNFDCYREVELKIAPEKSSEYELPKSNVSFDYDDPIICCKTCKIPFAGQVEFLEHIHDLFNTKAKLYADAKTALKTDSVQFKNPNSGNPKKEFLNDAELLLNIHRLFGKSKKENVYFHVARKPDDDDNDFVKRSKDPTICRCCSKPLPKRIKFGNKDKICTKCSRTEEKREKLRNITKAKLYACAKNVQLKNCAELMPAKTITSNSEEQLENVHQAYNATINHLDATGDSKSIQDYDLLKPIREEDEKVLVHLHDPTLCRNCLKPLLDKISKICEKCKTLEISNEKLKKCNNKKRSREKNELKFSKLQRKMSFSKHYCDICHSEFFNDLDLKNHIIRSHI